MANKQNENSLRTVYTIGEALIDFIPEQRDTALKDVEGFKRKFGGAPANVATVVSRLGGKSVFIGKVGQDAFGDYIIECFKKNGVDTTYVSRTRKAKTALAFVTLDGEGQRDFSFYRNPSADMLLLVDDLKDLEFTKDDFLSFGSVDLVESDVKYTTKYALKKIKAVNGTVLFDPNVRENLWDDLDELKKAIFEFMPYADILKVSDDEVKFLTGMDSLSEGTTELLKKPVKILIVTKGKDGAEIFLKGEYRDIPSKPVKVVDTTGAGDSFVGALLYQLSKTYLNVYDIHLDAWCEMIAFANEIAGITTTKEGAIV